MLNIDEKNFVAENNGFSYNKNKFYTLDELLNSISPSKYIQIQKDVIKEIPKTKNDLYSCYINFDIISDYNIKENKLKGFLLKKLKKLFDVNENFVEFLLEKLGNETPFEIENLLSDILGESTEEFMVNFWKSLIFEYLKIVKLLEIKYVQLK